MPSTTAPRPGKKSTITPRHSARITDVANSKPAPHPDRDSTTAPRPNGTEGAPGAETEADLVAALLMCKSSPVRLGTLNAQSHVEQMNSYGNLMVTKHRLRLSDDIVNKMVCIKINKYT